MAPPAHARRQRALAALKRAFPDLDPLQSNVFAALLERTADGWHLFLRHDLPAILASSAEAFLVGPTGLFAIVPTDRAPDHHTTQALLKHAEERCAGITGPDRGQVVPRTAVSLVLVSDGRDPMPDGRHHTALSLTTLPDLFAAHRRHISRRQADAIADGLAGRLAGYRRMTVPTPEKAPQDGFLDIGEITEDQVQAAQARSFESWLTFLHPQQRRVVSRRYNGPARVGGPAGTGKTVVALHRLRDLARRSTGPLLFTTLVHTLPLVVRSTFTRWAPELADRVEFVNLHAWAREFLRSRGHTVDQTNRAQHFNPLWRAHRDALSPITPDPDYWWEEIDRVIKGRGITRYADYAALDRIGRGTPLVGSQREPVWRLYEAYQRRLAEHGKVDHNDVLTRASAELAERPLETPYAGVVLDEVQDINMVGLQLAHRLGGDALLLVGDGQQQIYPGGWRLSDAGIPVKGRSETLRLNYRNRAEVVAFARRFNATNTADDPTEAEVVGLRAADVVNNGGTVTEWSGPAADLAGALRAALGGVEPGRTAVVALDTGLLPDCHAAVRQAGLTHVSLDKYQGEPGDEVKVGTVFRAKGLDFQAVFVVERADVADDPDLRDRRRMVAATRARDLLWWGRVHPR